MASARALLLSFKQRDGNLDSFACKGVQLRLEGMIYLVEAQFVRSMASARGLLADGM
jgi:hypothetical protein